MNMNTIQRQLPVNTILHGDCIEKMRAMPANSVDFILTDPPYLVNFRDRTGRTLQNDTNANWLKPAMAEAYRVLKQNRLMLCFYGWPRAEEFLSAWREAGFRPVGHLVLRKSYTTKSTEFLK
jgi:site-specific DNA-methyltransferase (adenine-specific)